MQQLTTVYKKHVIQNDQSVTPLLLEMLEIALPTPLRIDAPAGCKSYNKRLSYSFSAG